MSEQRMQFAIGIVTLAAGMALAAIILWFGEFQFALVPLRTYVVQFDNAPGIEPKVPVRRAGVRIGEVRSVTYDEQAAKVAVVVALAADQTLFAGDRLVLRRSFPLGDSSIDVETRTEDRGKADRAPVPAGSIVEGHAPPDAAESLQNAMDVFPKAIQTLDQVRSMAHQWDEVGQRMNLLLDLNEQRFTALLEDSRLAAERLVVALDAVNRTLDAPTQQNLKTAARNLRQISESFPLTLRRFDAAVAKYDEAAVNLKAASKPFAERSSNIVANLDTSALRLAAVLDDMQALTRRLRQEDGSLQRLMREPALYQNLDKASLLLIEDLEQLASLLSDLRVFADKIARHPGELGVQGVLTRDKGIKNFPTDNSSSKPRMLQR